MREKGICFQKILQQELPRRERGICFRKVFIKRMKGSRGSYYPRKLLDETQQR
jgi:hypothetical protein